VPSAFLFLAAALSLRLAFKVWRLKFGVSQQADGENSKLQTPNAKRQTTLARGCILGAFGVWLLFLGARTWLRQADWRDQRTFFERTIAAGGDSARMRMNLGNLEFQEGRPAQALAQYDIALKVAPDPARVWLSIAQVSLRLGDLPRTREALGKAEHAPQLTADLLLTRAALEQRETGRDPGALLQQAVEARPRSWPIRQRHLRHLDQTGHTATAARELRDFLREQPFRAESWVMLAVFLEKLGQPEAAQAARAQAAARDVRLGG